MAGDAITIGPLRDGDQERRHALGRQAFGHTRPHDPDSPDLSPDRTAAAYRGDALVGAMMTLAFEQTFGGSAIPCGGLSGVVVAPEARGLGLARSMLARSFDEMARRGEVISSLYPTTASLYRSAGYELVGEWSQSRLDPADIPTAPSAGWTWRPTTFADEMLRATHNAGAGLVDGWITLDEVFWQARAAGAANDASANWFAYLGEHPDGEQAGVIYTYGTSDRGMYGIEVKVIAASSLAGIAAVLGFVASNGTTAGHVETTLPADVLHLVVPHAQRAIHGMRWPWMLRLVDVDGALSARGYPAGVDARFDFDVVDDFRPRNAGRRVLAVSSGRAAVEPGGTGALRIDVTDLARLYAGTPPSLLAGSGRLEADGATLDRLATVFASRPSLQHFF